MARNIIKTIIQNNVNKVGVKINLHFFECIYYLVRILVSRSFRQTVLWLETTELIETGEGDPAIWQIRDKAPELHAV